MELWKKTLLNRDKETANKILKKIKELDEKAGYKDFEGYAKYLEFNEAVFEKGFLGSKLGRILTDIKLLAVFGDIPSNWYIK